ncbi:prolyl oligopeptidase family serine peptidase [Streptomyces litchfieldiae]|uniref:Prolyl oligopeptidase family serine peptidase n=1 Tax=Streptomyces litchfieldiae TaxID=3075543 RepID=A0ABU2MUD0_9ACTN|nr:prolyl oligopeptidase family serine peptidase [Streptomyces sp. DSM 44938]MDT0344923.1 prolyl oligopeptidase family serine peptidase [Streptomyces sp. DSM 44938]
MSTSATTPATAAFPRQFARTRRFTLGVPHAFTVAPGGARVLFLRGSDGEDPVARLWQLTPDGRERLVADPGPDSGSGITAYSADATATTVAFTRNGELWTVTADGAPPRRLAVPGPVTDPRVDPTGRRVAYVTDGALRVADLTAPGDRALATPEHADITYGLAEHVAAESMHRARGHWWSRDGRRLLVARVDTSPVRRWWIADPADPARPPRAIRYPAAGTPNAEVTLHVFGPKGGRTEITWDRAAFEYLATADWDAHGPLLSVQSRDQRTVRVLAADPATGATTTLHEERDPAWVALIPGAPLRTAAGALVTVTDAGGTHRLAVAGRPVTPDGLQVREVLGADGETVWFTASDEPTETHVWSTAPGRAAARVTDTPGVHRAHPATGALLLVSATERGRATALTRPGAAPVPLASHEAEPLLTPRVTHFAAGPRAIRTALLLPSWHTPGTRLPVLLSPYSGPAMQLVTRTRHAFFCEAQWFAEAGYAVVIADGRGTPGRGPAWEKEVHGDTLTPVIEDQVTALGAAAARLPDLDLSRVAIRGWSYGGTLATAALIRRPDVFHAGISGAAPSDQRLYDTHWRERFLGHPDDHPEAYDRSSPITEAAALRRPLLLIHGLADDNVVAAHTLRMSAALLAAGRPHRVLPLSGTAHRPTDESTVTHLLTHQLAFLAEALAAPAQQPPQL